MTLARRWILPTLLVIVAAGLMVRLGSWQIDRLEQRRELNARVGAQLNAAPLDLNQALLQSGDVLDRLGLEGMEYRQVSVQGEYDFPEEVALRNQAYQNRLGVHLLTPLRLQGSDQVILVDRGFAPQDDFDQGNLEQYREPGIVSVTGYLRASQTRPQMGRATDTPYEAGIRLASFYIADMERIGQQMPYDLPPAYIVQLPEPGAGSLLGREPLNLELTEGSHLGYAIQWFAFAAILLFGYPLYVKRSEQAGRKQIVETQEFERRRGRASEESTDITI